MADENQAVLDRIEKLMAMSHSSNPNEAAIALERAQKLMREHHLETRDIELNAINEETVNSVPGMKKRSHVTMLAQIIVRCFGIRFFWNPRNGRAESVTFIGPKDRLSSAVYVYTYLQRQLKIVRDDFRKQRRAYYKSHPLEPDPEYKRLLKEERGILIRQLISLGWSKERIFEEFRSGMFAHMWDKRYSDSQEITRIVTRECDSYVEGWMRAVSEKVQDYVTDENEEKLLLEYEHVHHPDLVTTSGRQRYMSDEELALYKQGLEDGRDGFDLYKGVGGALQGRLEDLS